MTHYLSCSIAYTILERYYYIFSFLFVLLAWFLWYPYCVNKVHNQYNDLIVLLQHDNITT